jgi:hypothetical protein
VCVEVKKAKFKKENVPVYKDKLMIMKRKDKKDICFMRITHDEKLGFKTKTSRRPE